jgi:hypothetical protein
MAETSMTMGPPATPIQPVVMSTAKTKTKALFFCSIPYSNYVFPNGKYAYFIDGKFVTDIVSEIEHLENEIANGHPCIFVKEAERTVEVFADPIVALRAKIEKEIRAEMAAATNPENDMGKSVQGPLTMANSSTVGELTAGGNSGAAKTFSPGNIKIK